MPAMCGFFSISATGPYTVTYWISCNKKRLKAHPYFCNRSLYYTSTLRTTRWASSFWYAEVKHTISVVSGALVCIHQVCSPSTIPQYPCQRRVIARSELGVVTKQSHMLGARGVCDFFVSHFIRKLRLLHSASSSQ